jgi:hypothetical protein
VRRGLVLLAWVAFLADLLVGAGFLMGSHAWMRTAGLAMLGGAVAVLAGLTLWFYVQNRRRASPPT